MAETEDTRTKDLTKEDYEVVLTRRAEVNRGRALTKEEKLRISAEAEILADPTKAQPRPSGEAYLESVLSYSDSYLDQSFDLSKKLSIGFISFGIAFPALLLSNENIFSAFIGIPFWPKLFITGSLIVLTAMHVVSLTLKSYRYGLIANKHREHFLRDGSGGESASTLRRFDKQWGWFQHDSTHDAITIVVYSIMLVVGAKYLFFG